MAKKKGPIKGVLFLVLILGVLILGLLLLRRSKDRHLSRDIARQKINAQNFPEQQNRANAPDFTVPRLGGGNFTLSSLKGKVIILNFWSTGCPPCRQEIPDFIELYKKYKDNGLEIVGACLDSEARAKPFAKAVGINYILVLAGREIVRQYGGIRYIPTTFIIDRRGNLAKKHIGYTSRETFEKEIKELLSEKAE